MADATDNPNREAQQTQGAEPLPSQQPAPVPPDASRRAVQHARLPLPDPYPDYVPCPHCGELEVEVWCYMSRVRCHNCGAWIEHATPDCLGNSPVCQAWLAQQINPIGQSPPVDRADE